MLSRRLPKPSFRLRSRSLELLRVSSLKVASASEGAFSAVDMTLSWFSVVMAGCVVKDALILGMEREAHVRKSLDDQIKLITWNKKLGIVHEME